MARQPDIQYVRFYTPGSAARKVELAPEPRKNVELPRPRVRRQPRKVIRLNPIALCAMVVAAALLVAMAVGVVELAAVSARVEKMESYAAKLQGQYTELRKTYEAGYDLADIEEKALAMGMVPSDRVEHIVVRVEPKPVEPEMSFWDEVRATIAELFA